MRAGNWPCFLVFPETQELNSRLNIVGIKLCMCCSGVILSVGEKFVLGYQDFKQDMAL